MKKFICQELSQDSKAWKHASQTRKTRVDKTHSVTRKLLIVCTDFVRFKFCIAFRVWKQTLNREPHIPPKARKAGNPLHLDNCTNSDSI